jgi:hypothetical protein
MIVPIACIADDPVIPGAGFLATSANDIEACPGVSFDTMKRFAAAIPMFPSRRWSPTS